MLEKQEEPRGAERDTNRGEREGRDHVMESMKLFKYLMMTMIVLLLQQWQQQSSTMLMGRMTMKANDDATFDE